MAAVGRGKTRLSNGERSAYFARREAAKVLGSVLQGDARCQAVGSIKSLIYRPCIRNKKATFALVCQTLKHLPIIKDVLDAATILNAKWKRQLDLIYIITYDILFGQAVSLVGDAEKFLMHQKDALQTALARLLVKKKVKTPQDLVDLYQIPEVSKPRYVRVNTLKMDVDSALLELGQQNMVKKDNMVPDLLILPPSTDLHNHPLVTNGSVFMQGKASSMVAAALDPKPGWEVLDACSAPGNKTVHLAALMRGKGKIIACELNKERVIRLKVTIKLSGASNIEVLHGDFLNCNPNDPSFSKVCAILLDPSCSGSGTASVRLDHLLPSNAAGHAADVTDTERLNKLAAFQRKVLMHALSFPAVERVVYSTCSIHQIENEDVIKSVLPLAASYGFQLATPFPQWQRRGLPVFEGFQHLLRTDPVEDGEGFFIALFTKRDDKNHSEEQATCRNNSKSLTRDGCTSRFRSGKKRIVINFAHTKLFLMWLHAKQSRRKRDNFNTGGSYRPVTTDCS
ncbi:25S rRNA (cytosine-C(5))-methyltransferase NSUN5 isoform X1 [Quercus suber]|uniref:25S rRNA (cytosine-C(5))-methyltransferase NSUN5 isoform X1 n=1 Tax=Quercus suber TaxID=58331 RepID=UPI000CE18083|nr:probable 28S rRNA (cytosine-C(5))-methyltransferase [Quercus suber]POF16057.1 isoform 4 of probable 28s rrna (cytosine-c(5))-methyltransferase [Quercus suber]